MLENPNAEAAAREAAAAADAVLLVNLADITSFAYYLSQSEIE